MDCIRRVREARRCLGSSLRHGDGVHLRSKLFAAAAAGALEGMAGLPRALYDLLRRWDLEGHWPAARWLESDAEPTPLPPWDLFGDLPMALFARGMAGQEPFLVPSLQRPLPAPAADIAAESFPWRMRLMGVASTGPSREGLRWLGPDLAEAELLAMELKLASTTALLNLGWPPLALAPRWLGALQQLPLVADPDPDRVVLLRQFGVAAFWRPFDPLPPAADPAQALLCAQQELGMVDPRWLLPSPEAPLALAVLGSSGPASERRWATLAWRRPRADLVLLPRATGLILASLEQVQALQCWLVVLAGCCRTLLLLEPLAEGVCRPPLNELARVRSAEHEEACLAHWESAL